MELQDIKNSKPIKVIAAGGVATTIAVATGSAPVSAHSSSYNTAKDSTYASSSNKNDKDCDTTKGDVKVIATPTGASVTTPTTTVKTTPTTAEVTVTPKPNATPVVTTASTTPAPAAQTETPAASTQAAAAPTSLPNTGPGAAVAGAAGVGVLGYVANLFRLKRKHATDLQKHA